MRLPAAFCLALLAAACASGGPSRPPAPTEPGTILARVLESREMDVVVGGSSMDVTLGEGFVHRIAPRDSPGTSFLALTHLPDCPVSGDAGRLYEMSFVQRRLAFGIRHAEDRQWMTSLVIASCRAVDGGE